MVKNKILALTILLTSSAFIGTAAFAVEPKQVVSAQLGVALPLVGDLEDIADTGINFGAQAMHRVDSRKSYGIGVSYFTFGKDSEQGVDTEVSIISTMMMTQTTLAKGTGGTPFIETGLGFSRTQVNIETPGTTGPAIVQGSNEEDISPTLLLGLGFDMPIADGATLGFSLDYQHFFFKVGDVDGGGALSILAHLRI